MDISNSLTYHITKTGNLLRQLTAKRIKHANINLTPEEAVIMNQLWDRDHQTFTELSQWSVKDASTLTRQIDGLVKKGYVEREHGTEDRRNVFIKLSTAGKALQQQFIATRVSALDEDVASLSASEEALVLKVLLSIREKALAELND